MKNIKYKTQGNFGLFDEQETYQKLSETGNPLEKISSVIDFEMFRLINLTYNLYRFEQVNRLNLCRI